MWRGRVGRRRRKKQWRPKVEADAIFALLKWVISIQHQEDGAGQLREHWTCHLQPYDFPLTGRGLRTKRRVEPGEIILSLPLQCLVTPQVVLTSDLGPIIQQLDHLLTPQRVLAAFLLWERHKARGSSWQCYLQTVPALYSTPAFLSHADLSLLPLWLCDDAAAVRNTVESVHKDLQKLLCSHIGEVTHGDVCWAWTAVNTRCVFFETLPSPHWMLTANESHCALAPFLDLLNHDPGAKMEARANHETGCYEIQTWDTYLKHDQVFICYGSHGNRKLWLEYGFAVVGNPCSTVEVSLDDLKRSHDQRGFKDWSGKLALMHRHSLDGGLHFTREGLSWTLESALRVLALEPEHMEGWTLSRLDTEPSPTEADRLRLVKKTLLALMLGSRQSAEKTLRESHLSPPLAAALALVEDEIQILEICNSQT